MRIRISLPILVFAASTLAINACGDQSTPAPEATPAATPAAAAPPGKIASGTITELVAGDAACYVTLKPDTGDAVTEMAEFEICEKPELVGTKVQLTWKQGEVLAAECQGDVDCGKTDKVWLISAVKAQ